MMLKTLNRAIDAAALIWFPAGLVLLWAMAPRLDDMYAVCVFQTALGYPCPGCGMTRSIAYLLRGRIVDSFALHPLGALTVLAGAAVWLFCLGMRFKGWVLPRATAFLILAALAVFTLVWIVRSYFYLSNGIPDFFR